MFGHDAEHALLTAVELLNTAPNTGGGEELPDLSALVDLVERREVSGLGELTDRDLTEVRALRDRLLGVVHVVERPDRAAALVNDLVAGSRATPRLTNHDGRPWHVHYFAPDATLAEHLAADCGMALARMIADDELDRLRRCEADDCDHILVDLSRNRSKRYCDSRRCGNRIHVAAYRERRRAAASA
jgi:predicted RNA-binding Zn ribbon-like protein